MEEQFLKHVLNKLYLKKRPATAVGLEQVAESVYEVLAGTVSLRRGDSCLLVGPRASGKTVLIESCMKRLETEFPGQFLTIRLNGLAHTDDKMALREISRQLDVYTDNPEQDSEKIEKSSLSSTLQGILKLFDDAEAAAFEADGSESPSPAPSKQSSVIFIVEEFDRFASNNRQTLLYNLLELTQSSSVGIAVVGATVRANIGESLEKRVRSRFSQRLLPLPRPKTREEFAQVCLSLLQVDDPLLIRANPDMAHQWNNRMAEIVAMPEETNAISDLVTSTFYATKDMRQFATQVAPLVLCIDETPSSNVLNVPSTIVSMLQDLAELDWAILICAARAQLRYSIPAVNLVIVQDEYRLMATQLQQTRSAGLNLSGYRIWSAKPVRHAWERLQNVDLVVPTGTDQGVPNDLRMMKPAAALQELREFLPNDNSLYSWTKL